VTPFTHFIDESGETAQRFHGVDSPELSTAAVPDQGALKLIEVA
jgi:hypothetical protein